MAEYPLLVPDLVHLNGVKSDPQDEEDAGKLAAVDRQTRTWLYEFLSSVFNTATSKLKPEAFEQNFPSGIIRGSTANGGTQREILWETVSDVDLRNAAVTTNKLALGAVTTERIAVGGIASANLAAGAVSTAALAASAVTGANIANNTIDNAKLVDKTISGNKIADLGVSAANLAAGSVTGSKLASPTAGALYVGDGATYNPVVMSGYITMDAAGVTSIIGGVGGSAAVIHAIELTNAGVAAGASPPFTSGWFQRGGGTVVSGGPIPPWSTAAPGCNTNANIFEVNGVQIRIKQNGLYWIRGKAPAYGGAGLHKCRLTTYPNAADLTVIERFEGTSSACAGNSTTTTTVEAYVTVRNVTTGLYGQVELDHHTTTYVAGNGLGAPTAIYGPPAFEEVYAELIIVKIA